MNGRIDAIAREIFRQHEEGETYRGLEGDLAPRDLDEAYAAQFALHELHVKGGRGPLGGRKIALSSKPLQELCGVDQPIAGGVFACEILESPAMVRKADFHGPGMEFELAVKLARDLGPGDGPFDRETIRGAVASLHPAYEIIIDRDADYSKLDALTMAADNAWCGGVILGPAMEGWRELDVYALPVALFWNDEPPVTAAKAGDSDPFGSLAWVVNLLVSKGQVVKAGEVVITGSVIRTRAPEPGDHIRYRIGEAEPVELRVE